MSESNEVVENYKGILLCDRPDAGSFSEKADLTNRGGRILSQNDYDE